MFGFPQALDEQDMDGGGESEQAMLPSSLTLECQDSKPNGAVHGFDMNSGLSVCEHLRGEEELRRWRHRGKEVEDKWGISKSDVSEKIILHRASYPLSPLLLNGRSNPPGDQAPSLQSGVQLHHAGSLHGDRCGRRFCCLPREIPGAAVQPHHLLSQSAAR